MTNQTGTTYNETRVMKQALTAPDGSALADMRFSVSTMYRQLDGRTVADISVIVERRAAHGWEFDSDLQMSAPAIKANGTGSSVGDDTALTVDFMTALHKAAVGYAPVGRFITLQAPK
jgi:hypothetical protein